jgi:alpha-1,3-glucan synthase
MALGHVRRLPGLPLILLGEEQGYYILDAIADNYVYGRQPIFPQTAWHTHGCFALNSRSFTRFCASRISEHHTTTAIPHPLRNMFQAINDGWFIQKQTASVYYPGSNGTATVTGMWSILRGTFRRSTEFWLWQPVCVAGISNR